MANFATLEALENLYKPISDESERIRANKLLSYTSNYLRQIASNNSLNIDDRIKHDEVFAETVEMVVLSAVIRVLSKPSDIPYEATQYSQSATPYAESMSFSNNNAYDIYFKNKELQLLGLSSITGGSKMAVVSGIRGKNYDGDYR